MKKIFLMSLVFLLSSLSFVVAIETKAPSPWGPKYQKTYDQYKNWNNYIKSSYWSFGANYDVVNSRYENWNKISFPNNFNSYSNDKKIIILKNKIKKITNIINYINNKKKFSEYISKDNTLNKNLFFDKNKNIYEMNWVNSSRDILKHEYQINRNLDNKIIFNSDQLMVLNKQKYIKWKNGTTEYVEGKKYVSYGQINYLSSKEYQPWTFFSYARDGDEIKIYGKNENKIEFTVIKINLVDKKDINDVYEIFYQKNIGPRSKSVVIGYNYGNEYVLKREILGINVVTEEVISFKETMYVNEEIIGSNSYSISDNKKRRNISVNKNDIEIEERLAHIQDQVNFGLL